MCLMIYMNNYVVFTMCVCVCVRLFVDMVIEECCGAFLSLALSGCLWPVLGGGLLLGVN